MDTTFGPLNRASSRVTVGTALDAWAGHDWSNGVLVDQLAALDRLIVHTRNSIYELIVVSPGSAEVLVRGGSFFPAFTRARIAGSSLGGSFLKLHGVYVGFCLEIVEGGRSIVTTKVRSVTSAPPASESVEH